MGCNLEAPVSESINTTPPTKERNDTAYLAYIETSAGADVETFLNLESSTIDSVSPKPLLMPFPVNKGFIYKDGQKYTVWVLSKRLEVGEVIAIHPVGLLQYHLASGRETALVAVAADKGQQTIAARNFRELITVYEPSKYLFEHWLKNRYGLGSATAIKWSDEEEARQYLD